MIGNVAGAASGALRRIWAGTRKFAGRVYHKAGQDDIFFLAGGIAFNILLGAVPFLFLLISAFGYILRTHVDDPADVAMRYIFEVLPASPELVDYTSSLIADVLEGSTQFGILGLILLVWVSTRLIGSLRSALRDVFDVQEDRGIIGGKIFDFKMVIVAGSLFVANAAITVSLEIAQTYGIELLGLSEGGVVRTARTWFAQVLAFAFIFLMYVLIYRYLPARRIAWRIALVSGTFSATVFELLKAAFAFYVSYVASYRTAYGALGTLVVLVFWIYYSSAVFVLGGEVGQVYELYRTRRRQKELLD
jgi:membrane protein